MPDRTPPGPAILVVEDEPLVALAVEDLLVTLGIRVIGPAPNVAKALGLVEQGGFDGALLDVSLRGERVDAVADALAARGIPFVFTTGHGVDALPEGHRQRPLLVKPFRNTDLNKAVAHHLLPDHRF